jgi:hypothetical protein
MSRYAAARTGTKLFLEEVTASIAEQILHVDTLALVSLTLRPILGSGWNAYVYGDEYATHLQRDQQFQPAERLDWVGPSAQHYRITESNYRRFGISVCNEGDGPEIITVARAAAVFPSVTRSIVELAATMVNIISEKNEQKKAGGEVDRYHPVSAVSIEIRSGAGGKQLINLNLPSQESIDTEVVAGILGDTIQDLFPARGLAKVTGSD